MAINAHHHANVIRSGFTQQLVGETTVQYAIEGLSQNLFVSKYRLQLPSEDDIRKYMLENITEEDFKRYKEEAK